MATVLLWVSLALLLVVVLLAAFTSYRRRQRTAQARSRAALNRLLAEADEIAQAAKRDQDPPD
jgi:cytochrome c-type biogenesis protein CcmH/NrfF